MAAGAWTCASCNVLMKTNRLARQPEQAVLLVFGVMALIFGGIGAAIALSVMNERARMVHTEGSIVDLLRERDSEGDTLYRPVFRFTTAAGQAYEVESDMRSNPPSHELEQRVPVRYDPVNPSQARLDTLFENWFLPGLFCLFGVVFGAVSGGMLLSPLRRRLRRL